MIDIPLEPVGNGRDAKGRFTRGNRAAKGNPMARRVQKLRAAIIRAVSPEAVAEIVGTLVELARAGDVQAAKVLLGYTVGRPESVDVWHHNADASEPQRVEVVIDGNWYGNQARLAEVMAERNSG